MMPYPMLRWLALILCAASLVGCGVQQATPIAAADTPIAAADRIATDVAAARAVAATLTAGVPTPTVSPTAAASPADALPTDTPAPLPTDTPAPLPTDTPAPLPTDTPTDVPDEPLPEAYPPPGNASNVTGGIVMLGNARLVNYSENNNLEIAFKSPLRFRVLAYVPSADGHNKDGAGIKEVRFEITGPVANGENGIVYEHTEQSAAYCVFANSEPACPAWDFAANDNKWPTGEQVQFGENYHVQINIDGIDGQNQANWNFNFTIEAP